MDYDITEERRAEYRRVSMEARAAKASSMETKNIEVPDSPIDPELDSNDLMPMFMPNGLTSLSLFSGGGGMDLGFERAGFAHVASYDILDICGDTLRYNRPAWKVFSGKNDGDVKNVDFSIYNGKVDVLHGGPPCQPFSVAGSQKGKDDERNMWPEFIRAINAIKPKAFVAENVTGILNKKFEHFVKTEILNSLSAYQIISFKLNSAMFGVPQNRQRVFFVGFLKKIHAKKFKIPIPTHSYEHLDSRQKTICTVTVPKTMGVRVALGLPDIGFDALAPTLRSAFTGKRNTTSILNSAAGQHYWGKLKLWPNGVAENRGAAQRFIPKNQHQRLAVQDCAIIQGFPESWKFEGAVYQVLGQIGNSVCPPVAYHVASGVYDALRD